MEKLHLTQAGLDKMKADLAECKKKVPLISAEIEHARSYGDLRENAEYHAAKEAQANLHAMMHGLEDKIARARVVDESQIDASKAYLGATVRVMNKKTSKEFVYKLVSPPEADMAAGKISMKSPVGQALAGKSVGEVAQAKVPAGTVEFEVLEISR
ncbi:MAG: transcription elongation factor GreA [bacterium]|nr:transcription elongation factor GreA [bacterium]